MTPLNPRVAAWLFGLALVVYLGKGDAITQRGLDANIHAAVARATVSDGWWPVMPAPVLNEYSWGEHRRTAQEAARLRATTGTDAPYLFNDHPVLIFWLQGLAMKAFGPSAWAARLPTAVFAAACVVLVYALGTGLASPALGLGAALLFLLTREFVVSAVQVSLDPPLVCVILLSFLLWARGRKGWAAAAAGLGFWIKTPVALLVLPIEFLVEVRREPRRASLNFLRGLGIALGVGALYWALVYLRTGSFEVMRDYFDGQIARTLLDGRQGGTYRPFQFPWHLALTFWPFLPLVLAAPAFRSTRAPVLRTAGIALAVMWLAFAGMKSTLNHYFLPAYPFLALLAAVPLERVIQRALPKWEGAVAAMAMVAALIAGVTPVSFGPEPFPALRKFAPYIQATDRCVGTPVIAWIPGGETTGGPTDAVFWLNFMTARTVVVAECGELPALMARADVRWVIAAPASGEVCLKQGTLKHFARYVQYGSQRLYFHEEISPPEGDLSPLGNENRATWGCPSRREAHHAVR